MISEFDYCSKVCKAKCCQVHGLAVACPMLAADCSCKIYAMRFHDGAPDTVKIGRVKNNGRTYEFSCTRISNLLKAGGLPKEIRDQCCIANPKLLTRNYDI